ncbi:MAG: LCP family protein [Candidatus Buchananbacteria bacterium]|nr:LCP family protein [Candidatus Buchananbacteria bacterium]
MDKPEVDFLDEKNKIVTPQPKRKAIKLSKLAIYLVAVFLVIGIIYSIGIISSGENLAQKFGNVGIIGQIGKLISSDNKALQGEDQDRINVLLLGIGGGDHDGPYLTDTMIVLSLKLSTKQVSLISLPRDLLVPIPGYGWRKINSTDAFGEAQNPEHGGELAMQVVSQVLNIPIQYYLRIDFAGFVKIINDLGGLTLNVDNTLDDSLYPIPGKETATTTERYEHLYIPAGQYTFDGATALKYVRSRQAKGIEGSDFARSQRQQKILLAVKDKALKLSTLANPYKVSQLMDTLSQHLSTNMQVWELLKLYQMGKNINHDEIINRVFDDSPDGPLKSTITSEGAWVLETKIGDFSELQNIAQNIFDPMALASAKPRKIEVQNGTKIEGLASRTTRYLQSLGYQVITSRNAPTQDYQKTVVYNLNQDPDPKDTAKNVGLLLNSEVSPSLPSWVTATSSQLVSPNADILIILGQDRKEL